MTTDFPTASLGSSQAPTDAVEKSPSASNTKIRTVPNVALVTLHVLRNASVETTALVQVGLAVATEDHV